MTYTDSDIEWMKHTRRLKLSVRETLEHYYVVIFLCLIPLFSAYFQIKAYPDKVQGIHSAKEDFMTTQLPFLVLALIAFYHQRRRLNFRVIHIAHSANDFHEAARRTAETLQWWIETDQSNFLRAFRSWNWTSSSGEMIVIIRDGDTLMLNSVSDLNRRTSFLSFGWDKRNIDLFLLNLTEVIRNIPQNTRYEEAEAKKWYAKTYMRYIAYFCSTALLALGIFLLINGELIMGLVLVALVSFYVYSDIHYR
jgi:hypothetical protein